ncbi:VOC family protein [Frigidibacter sp.]|uniref:VOC family protein n=1 Tax=Frigidibacter sp. TaxID=2586418 RepID=UPI0027332FC3|nr:VOC family protein [Frigidibacter sp.]MDP3342194.1 VOC family protein [Frigidibacter sp.]
MAQIVHAAGHLKINAKDVEALVKDSTEVLGLRVTRETGNQVWLSSNGRMAELVVVEAEENSAHTIGLEALTAEDVKTAASRIEAAGCTIVDDAPSLDCMDAGVTFTTPEGLRFEIHSPIRDAIFKPRYDTLGVGPRRLDHINLLTPDPLATQTQLKMIGDLRLAEKLVDDSLAWFYGGNRQHHILGLVKSHAPGIHHYSFEFVEFNMYCRLGDLLDGKDRQVLWGPGRHRPGDNTYAYYLDASGAMVECSGPMACIADEQYFEPRIITNLARPGNVREMNVWGSPAPLEWRQHFHPFMAL